jgi:hypothetical protein
MSRHIDEGELKRLFREGDRRKIVRALARMLREAEVERERLEKLRSITRR